jgi:hypothetical protein
MNSFHKVTLSGFSIGANSPAAGRWLGVCVAVAVASLVLFVQIASFGLILLVFYRGDGRRGRTCRSPGLPKWECDAQLAARRDTDIDGSRSGSPAAADRRRY